MDSTMATSTVMPTTATPTDSHSDYETVQHLVALKDSATETPTMVMRMDQAEQRFIVDGLIGVGGDGSLAITARAVEQYDQTCRFWVFSQCARV